MQILKPLLNSSLHGEDPVYMHQPLRQYPIKYTQQKQSMSQLFYGLRAASLLVMSGINQQVTDIHASR